MYVNLYSYLSEVGVQVDSGPVGNRSSQRQVKSSQAAAAPVFTSSAAGEPHSCLPDADWGKAGAAQSGQGIVMLLVTGGAGFIGSNVVAALNDAGRADVAVCDVLGHDGKWRNLAKRQLADIVPPAELPAWLKGRRLDAIIHLGAISETTATDGDLVIETNFRLSMRLLDWCTAHATPLIYASSAATYGDGAQGFGDDPSTGGAEDAAADESVRLEQASVRHGGGRARGARRKAAAAMGRPEILQRVRPQ